MPKIDEADEHTINYNLDQYLTKLEGRIKHYTETELPLQATHFNLEGMSVQ
jgi:hypothetical protein